jgi:hypothetical protein
MSLRLENDTFHWSLDIFLWKVGHLLDRDINGKNGIGPHKADICPGEPRAMAGRKERSSCMLSLFEKRLYCAKKRVTKGCLYVPFLRRRCPYLVWNKDDVMEEAKRGAKEINAWSGFTESAIQYADRFRPRLRLVHRDETVKSRRRKPRVVAITA